MREAGIKRLDVCGASVSDFAACFPDQKQLLSLAAGGKRRAGGMLVSEVMQNSGYDGPPELWTMYACLCADRDAQKVAVKWLERHVDALRQVVLNFVNEHGFDPHLAHDLRLLR